jgi:hypothetical protein
MLRQTLASGLNDSWTAHSSKQNPRTMSESQVSFAEISLTVDEDDQLSKSFFPHIRPQKFVDKRR